MRISRDSMAEWQSGANGNRLSQFIPTRDYTGLNIQDDQLRIWLPECAKQALTELSELLGMRISVNVTSCFGLS